MISTVTTTKPSTQKKIAEREIQSSSKELSSGGGNHIGGYLPFNFLEGIFLNYQNNWIIFKKIVGK